MPVTSPSDTGRSAVRPARVVYVEGNDDGTIGGSYFSLLYLVESLDRTRFAPTVVFHQRHALQARFEATAPVVVIDKLKPVHFLGRGAAGGAAARWLTLPVRGAQSATNFARLLLTARRYARFLRAQKADLLHLNNSITRTHDWMIAARLAGIPCVVHERGINDRFHFPTRQLAPGLAAVLCISQAAHDNLVAHGFAGSRLHVVHNGLDPAIVVPSRSPEAVRAAHGIPAGAPVVTMVGNIREWKGQEILVRALPALVRAVPGVRCLFVGEATPGDEPYAAKLRALLDASGTAGHAIFTGYTKTPADFLQISDVAVHASTAPEPFGRVLLEAMALHKPVVGSQGGAVTEIVVDGETGYTFTPGDSGELAARILDLLEHPERARLYGDAGHRRLLAEFHVARNVARTSAIYDRVLQAMETGRGPARATA
jgi:glycosyltransferase involved in cell wall biosynthesis